MPIVLSTQQLRAAQVPGPQASWDEVQAFALTFDGYKHFGPKLSELAEEHASLGTVPTSLDAMRGCLFFEQRRWRHFGEVPSGKAMEHIRALVHAIGVELSRVRVQL